MANVSDLAPHTTGPIDIPQREFSWFDWRNQNEPFIWELFNNITRTIEHSNVTMLDNVTFEAFMNFCQKHTSRPVEIQEEIPEQDLEPELQKQEETESDGEIIDDWYY
jgi:hypothetical protein